MQRTNKKSDLKVFISFKQETKCAECGEELGPHGWITMTDKGPLCLSCDLDHLIFLASGDTALTRRARKHSTLVAVVLNWSRAVAEGTSYIPPVKSKNGFGKFLS